MAADKFGKSMVIVGNEDPGDEVAVGRRHVVVLSGFIGTARREFGDQ